MLKEIIKMEETVATLETVYIIISNNNVIDIGLICLIHVSTDVSTGFNCGYGGFDLRRPIRHRRAAPVFPSSPLTCPAENNAKYTMWYVLL